MTDVLDWLTRYPLWIIVVLAATAFVLFAAKLIAEMITEKRAEILYTARLRAEGRTAFEDRVLTDRYDAFNALFSRLVRITHELERVHSGRPALTEPFLVRNGSRTEVVPLAEALEELEVHRLVLGDEMYAQFSEATDLVRRMADASPAEASALTTQWGVARNRLRELAETEFGLSRIHWRGEQGS